MDLLEPILVLRNKQHEICGLFTFSPRRKRRDTVGKLCTSTPKGKGTGVGERANASGERDAVPFTCGGSVGKYFPFGQERPSATTDGKEKFATYFRDSETGLDYADQRYERPGMGRFMTPDSY